ncbi:MAG: phosphate acyltransferase PlsX [Nitrospirae bacterium]|nr:phosphate acyltransferase PlsX [Nitrospirota bacterium]
MKMAVDAMGGDDAPAPVVEGAVLAAREYGVGIILVGDSTLLREMVGRRDVEGLDVSIVHASQKVEMDEAPSVVIRRKRESSIWIATDLVKKGEAVAVISAGNSGATMATALFILGPLKGVERPAIATILPTLTGHSILLDVGANVDCKPLHLFQFATMGHEYAEWVLQKSHPKVGLLSIGEEDTKGNEVTKEAFKILKAGPLNFIGNVEGRDVYSGAADVIVCDGFIGNVALKISEGLADALGKLLKREIAATVGGKLGYLFLRSAFQRFRRRVDYAEYGGAPLLGVNGISIICHGRSSAKAIKNAVRVAKTLAEQEVNERIRKDIEDSMAIYSKAHEEYLQSLKRD